MSRNSSTIRLSLFAFALLQFVLPADRALAAAAYELKSPNGKIEVSIQAGERLTYDVRLNGKTLLQGSRISIDVDHKIIGLNPKVEVAKKTTVDQEIEPVVRQKFAKLRENYNQLRLEMEGSYTVVFRAYNEGVAYRIETSLPQSEVKVYSEEAKIGRAHV